MSPRFLILVSSTISTIIYYLISARHHSKYWRHNSAHIRIQTPKLREWEKVMAPHSYSCLENPMDGGAWWAALHGVARSRTRLSGFSFTFHFHALEKEMATHSSVLAWRIPETGEPGGLPPMGSHRVGHDWLDLAANLENKWKATMKEYY